jgi:hypothetical protein
MQIKIKGGVSETEVNEFAVIPLGTPSGPSVATTVTPVTKQPNAFLSSPGSTAGLATSMVNPPSATCDAGARLGITAEMVVATAGINIAYVNLFLHCQKLNPALA